jgi:hypothetical protein
VNPARTPRRRPFVPALAALALAVTGVAAGCGGGGGGGSSALPVDPLAAMPAPTGLTAADVAGALGTMAAPDQATLLASVGRYDRFGTLRDPFRALVSVAAPAATPAAPTTPGTLPTTGTGTTGGLVVPPTTGLPLMPGVVPTTPGTTTPPITAPAVTTPNPLEADLDVSGEPLVVREGDAVPPDSQEFRVERLRTGSMTLKLTAGLLPDGTDTFTLAVGKRVTLYDQSERRTYRLRLNAIRRVR